MNLSKFPAGKMRFLIVKMQRNLNLDQNNKNLTQEELEKLIKLQKILRNESTFNFEKKRGFFGIFGSTLFYALLFVAGSIFFSEAEIFTDKKKQLKIALVSNRVAFLFCEIHLKDFLNLNSELLFDSKNSKNGILLIENLSEQVLLKDSTNNQRFSGNPI